MRAPLPSLAMMLALALPGGARAFDPSACQRHIPNGEGHTDWGAVTDLGGGIVVQGMESAGVWSGANYAVFEACRTGEVLEVMNASWTEVDAEPAATDPVAVMKEAIASSRRYSWEDVAELMAARGLQVSRQAAGSQESCRCAAAYPELRGDKVPWGG